MKCDAVAYILWGGQYDVREMELIEYPIGSFHYEDNTGGYLTLHNCYPHDFQTAELAKFALLQTVFTWGEDTSYVDFGEAGIIRKSEFVMNPAHLGSHH